MIPFGGGRQLGSNWSLEFNSGKLRTNLQCKEISDIFILQCLSDIYLQHKIVEHKKLHFILEAPLRKYMSQVYSTHCKLQKVVFENAKLFTIIYKTLLVLFSSTLSSSLSECHSVRKDHPNID